jgi:YjjG family noncanonical pyrimidine nucleotidase
MANYTCILLDADNTILDFDMAERQALTDTLVHYELPHDSAAYELYHKVNTELWAALARGELSRNKLFDIRFSRYLQALGAADISKSVEMNSYYESQLALHPDVIPGAIEALRELGEVATIAIVSNGAVKVQQQRLADSGVADYVDGTFISEQVGAAKPSAKIFETALRELGITNRSRVLVVGDDLLADIKGGLNAGLDTCWVNFKAQDNTETVHPKFTVQSFEELYRIVMEPEELENVGSKSRRHMNDC